jgi:hypothetical protein
VFGHPSALDWQTLLMLDECIRRQVQPTQSTLAVVGPSCLARRRQRGQQQR